MHGFPQGLSTIRSASGIPSGKEASGTRVRHVLKNPGCRKDNRLSAELHPCKINTFGSIQIGAGEFVSHAFAKELFLCRIIRAEFTFRLAIEFLTGRIIRGDGCFLQFA